MQLSSPAVRVLVTGAAGFIGSNVMSELRAAGYAVVGLDRRPGPGIRRFDLADPIGAGALAKTCAEVDAVIHLAGRPGVRDRSPDIQGHRHRDNVVATGAVLEATPPNTPLVVASSSSVYGGAQRCAEGGLRPSREDDPLHPRGEYARTKVTVEGMCAHRAESGGRVAVIRPFTVAGEGQRPDMAVARWIAAARSGRPLTILGSPQRLRDLTDVAQVARAIRRILEVGYEGTLNLGSGTAHRLIDIVEHVLAVVGRPAQVTVARGTDDEAEATLADTTRSRQVLGLTMPTDLRGVIERQVAASGRATMVGAAR